MPATIEPLERAPSKRIVEKALEECKSGGIGWKTFSSWVHKHKAVGDGRTIEERVHESQGGNFLETVIVTKAAESLGVKGSPDEPKAFIDFAAETVEQITREHGVSQESALTIVANVSRGIIAAPVETREEVVEMIAEGELSEVEVITDLSNELIKETAEETVEVPESEEVQRESARRNLGGEALANTNVHFGNSFAHRLFKRRFAFSKS